MPRYADTSQYSTEVIGSSSGMMADRINYVKKAFLTEYGVLCWRCLFYYMEILEKDKTFRNGFSKRAVIDAYERVKAVAIPKKNGGTRILGIPTVEDRIVQMMAKICFEPKVESIFYEDSYGYRPNKSANRQ